MNGTIKMGFMTIGAPKMIGSLILKIPGTKDSLPSSFKYFDFENRNSTTSDNVDPAPPIQTNH
ncbi:Uncharacterised protein [Chlamydia trachomatis]|nr:Uncharacterised protein [Chlamydia trachomatis]